MHIEHRRRLVINIGGGKNLGHKYWEGKHFGEIYFQTKTLEKFPSILSKISDDLFYSHRQPFYKIYTFHSKCTPFSLYCCLCFCFLSCLFFSINKIKKFLSDYWGAKKGFCPPILIIGGRG